MNRYDEEHPRSWRHDRDRDEGFREGEYSGRTGADAERQPYSGNPYGYHPGQDRPGREWRGRGEWSGGEDVRDNERRGGESRHHGSSWSQPYGQREPYNARG